MNELEKKQKEDFDFVMGDDIYSNVIVITSKFSNHVSFKQAFGRTKRKKNK